MQTQFAIVTKTGKVFGPYATQSMANRHLRYVRETDAVVVPMVSPYDLKEAKHPKCDDHNLRLPCMECADREFEVVPVVPVALEFRKALASDLSLD